MYTATELQLFESEYKGIKGITCLDHGNPGPTVAIFGVTHGNEISGFEALEFLMEDMELAKREIHGKILLIVHNLKAYQGYRSAVEDNISLKNIDFRCIDINLNRVFLDEFLDDPKHQDAYEIQRAKEIRKIIPEIDYALDMHSTSSPTEPMVIYNNVDGDKALADAICMQKHIIGIEKYIHGRTLTECIRNEGRNGEGAPVITIESGFHFQSESQKIAKESAVRFLEHLGVVELIDLQPPTAFQSKKYLIEKSVMPTHTDFRWVKEWEAFQEVSTGTVLAEQGGEAIIAEKPYAIIMPTFINVIGEEAGYLATVL